MDPITAAIVAALTAGAISGLTDTSKTTITDAYNKLKALLSTKFGPKSEVIQAIDHLETKPDSASRQGGVQEEIATLQARKDEELIQAAQDLSNLIHAQQAATGKFTIQTNAPVYGQTIGDHNTISQQFVDPSPITKP